MSLVVVSARVHADNVDAVAGEARRTMAAIASAAPDAGYLVCRAPDGVTFLGILDAHGPADPLLAVPAYVEYQQAIHAWAAAPPTSETWEVIGSYGRLAVPEPSTRTTHRQQNSTEHWEVQRWTHPRT